MAWTYQTTIAMTTRDKPFDHNSQFKKLDRSLTTENVASTPAKVNVLDLKMYQRSCV